MCRGTNGFPTNERLTAIKLTRTIYTFGTDAGFCGSSFFLFLLQFRMEIKQAPVPLAKSLTHF